MKHLEIRVTRKTRGWGLDKSLRGCLWKQSFVVFFFFFSIFFFLPFQINARRTKKSGNAREKWKRKLSRCWHPANFPVFPKKLIARSWKSRRQRGKKSAIFFFFGKHGPKQWLILPRFTFFGSPYLWVPNVEDSFFWKRSYLE